MELPFAESWKIKMVEPIKKSTREQREQKQRGVGKSGGGGAFQDAAVSNGTVLNGGNGNGTEAYDSTQYPLPERRTGRERLHISREGIALTVHDSAQFLDFAAYLRNLCVLFGGVFAMARLTSGHHGLNTLHSFIERVFSDIDIIIHRVSPQRLSC